MQDSQTQQQKAYGPYKGMNENKRYNPATPEMYKPMEVPEHIYVAGVERKPANKDTRPQMVVPGKITVGGGESVMATKGEPAEVLRERQNMPPVTPENNGIIRPVPETLTANELPQEDFQRQINQTPENPHYSSQTSIVVDRDPLAELKLMRRRLIQLSKRVENLELENKNYQDERPYIIGAGAGFIFTLGIILVHLLSRR